MYISQIILLQFMTLRSCNALELNRQRDCRFHSHAVLRVVLNLCLLEVTNVNYTFHCQLHVSLACFHVCASGSSVAEYPDYSRVPAEKRHLRACVRVRLARGYTPKLHLKGRGREGRRGGGGGEAGREKGRNSRSIVICLSFCCRLFVLRQALVLLLIILLSCAVPAFAWSFLPPLLSVPSQKLTTSPSHPLLCHPNSPSFLNLTLTHKETSNEWKAQGSGQEPGKNDNRGVSTDSQRQSNVNRYGKTPHGTIT